MLIYKVGNLVEAPENIIAHGCNAQGVMGSGVALAIRNAFPRAFQEYKNHYAKYGLFIGDNVYAPTDGKIIVNCITQEYYGREKTRYVSYDAIASCMKKIKSNILLYSVAMPKIGSMLGGGDWNVIEAIIKSELNDRLVTIYVLDQNEIPQ